MAIDFTKPTTGDNYSTQFVPNLIANQIALGMMLDSVQNTVTGTPPTYTKRYNRTNGYFDEFGGISWAELPLNYLKLSGGTLTGGLSGTTASFSAGITGSLTGHASLDLALTGGTLTGTISFLPTSAQLAIWRAASVAASYQEFRQGGTSVVVGYIGTDGGAIIAGGTGLNFGIRTEYDLIFMAGSAERMRISSAGTVTMTGSLTSASVNTSGSGNITAGTGAIGTISIVPGNAGNTGYTAFYATNGNRQGYIGFSSTTGVGDSGTIPFIMAIASFNGTVAANLFSGPGTGLSGTAASLNIGGNSATAGGFTPSATAAAANRIVVADASGFINNNYFNGSDEGTAGTPGTVTGILTKRGDNFYRTTNAASVAAYLSGSTMNIVGSASSATTATNQSGGTVSATTITASSTISATGLVFGRSGGGVGLGRITTTTTTGSPVGTSAGDLVLVY